MIIIPSTIDKITTLVDKSLKISVISQELTPTQMSEIMQLFQKYGFFLFAAEEEAGKLETVELPPLPIREKDQRSPSEYQRALIYRLWEKTGKSGGNFEFFYQNYMNEIAKAIKAKIDSYN